MFSGAAFLENIYFVINMPSRGIYLGAASLIAVLISIALAFIYTIVIFVYLLKERQDGSFMYPLTILGIIQAIMISAIRIYCFIELIIYFQGFLRDTNLTDILDLIS